MSVPDFEQLCQSYPRLKSLTLHYLSDEAAIQRDGPLNLSQLTTLDLRSPAFDCLQNIASRLSVSPLCNVDLNLISMQGHDHGRRPVTELLMPSSTLASMLCASETLCITLAFVHRRYEISIGGGEYVPGGHFWILHRSRFVPLSTLSLLSLGSVLPFDNLKLLFISMNHDEAFGVSVNDWNTLFARLPSVTELRLKQGTHYLSRRDANPFLGILPRRLQDSAAQAMEREPLLPRLRQVKLINYPLIFSELEEVETILEARRILQAGQIEMLTVSIDPESVRAWNGEDVAFLQKLQKLNELVGFVFEDRSAQSCASSIS
jgi:hypothetical protein